MNARPSALLLKDRRTGNVVIVHFAFRERNEWRIAWGKPTRLSEAEFRKKGLTALLKSLREFHKRDADEQSKVLQIPEHRRLAFAKRHLNVGVELRTPSLLLMTPSRRMRDGYIGETSVRIKLPCTPAKFSDKLEGIFAQCAS
jgi:hypothetical protein